MPPPVEPQFSLDLLDEPAATVSHGDGIVRMANAAFLALLGTDVATIADAPLARLVSPADATALATASAATEAMDVALGFATQAGTVAMACRFGPVRDGHRLLRLAPAAAQPSVSEIRALEAEVTSLRQNLAWFREAIDKVGHSVVIFDQQDRLVLCNKFYRDGYRSGDRVLPADISLEGKTYRELMELRVRYKLHKEFADEPEKFIADRVQRFEEGSDSITYLATGYVVRSQYRRLAGGNRVYIGTDITELVETAQRERAAEHAYRTKSQFLANMSHELRTPLNAIIGFSELIRDAAMGPVDSRYRSYADDIHGAGQHLLNLINDILDLSKIEVGRMTLREATLDIADVVGKCCRLVHEHARENGLTLIEDIPAETPCLLADELRLKQIVINLLSNAIKFTPAGGTMRITAAALPDGRLALSVADTGIGMSPADINKAMMPFEQLDRIAGRGRDGTGLGLPLAKTLTELHGAKFEIHSEPNAGTTVTITMPAERVLHVSHAHARGA